MRCDAYSTVCVPKMVALHRNVYIPYKYNIYIYIYYALCYWHAANKCLVQKEMVKKRNPRCVIINTAVFVFSFFFVQNSLILSIVNI